MIHSVINYGKHVSHRLHFEVNIQKGFCGSSQSFEKQINTGIL